MKSLADLSPPGCQAHLVIRWRLTFVLGLVAGLLGTMGCRSIPADLSPRLPAKQLFNGRDLSGFYTWLVDTRYDDPRQVFAVSNGMLRVSGDGLGYLATREIFADFTLTVEFRWGNLNTHWGNRIGKARDAGIFLHATGPDGNSHDGGGAFMAAIECNMFEGATGDLLLIRGDDELGKLIAPRVTVAVGPDRDSDGWPWWAPDGTTVTLERWGRVNWRHKDAVWTDRRGFRGARDVEHPSGEWNRLVITCLKDVIEVRLNGVLVNRATQVWPRHGRILLQCEGSEYFVRRMVLQPF